MLKAMIALPISAVNCYAIYFQHFVRYYTVLYDWGVAILAYPIISFYSYAPAGGLVPCQLRGIVSGRQCLSGKVRSITVYRP